MNNQLIKAGKTLGLDLLYDIAGCAVFSLGLHVFSAPNHIAPGGVSGLSVLVNYLIAIPIGTVSLLLNIPLLLLGLKFLGKAFTLRTMKSLLIMTIMLDVVVAPLPTYTGDPFLAALFGGVCMGSGLAIVFMRGSTTGGSDIISRLIKRKFPHIQLGRLLFIIDLFVLALSAVVFQNIESALYGLISIYTSATMVDTLLYGLDMGKMAFIVSDKSEEISKKIIEELHRGATMLKAQGAWSFEERKVLLVAIRKNQFYKLKKLVYAIDENAFMIISEAGEIVGNGFKHMDDDPI